MSCVEAFSRGFQFPGLSGPVWNMLEPIEAQMLLHFSLVWMKRVYVTPKRLDSCRVRARPPKSDVDDSMTVDFRYTLPKYPKSTLQAQLFSHRFQAASCHFNKSHLVTRGFDMD